MSVFGMGRHGGRRTRNDLRSRRRSAMLYRLGIALCAGLAVWAALQCVVSLTANQPVVVAGSAIGRGETIDARQLTVVTVPASAAMGGMFDDSTAIVGKIARVDIDVGSPILTSMIGETPTVEASQTTVQVTLASVPESLIPGDVVKLVTASATLSGHATVITVPRHDDAAEAGGSGGGLLSGTSDDDAGSTVTFAMAPNEALATLKAQQDHPILAVQQ
ncbi:SAF domain-containing protein [Bifidobacterium simiarum]|uniref:SAF domain-containing protein n=1 Tax=Bifidobacterium simiarum TaxID=2045441 RepID=UPI001BDCF1F5|nr:SAF domain-containing protein [Bifidobacterium simiarum]MBT1166069.1 SAF domain-containing protein [Bifidobacterium simiarum]